MLLLWAILLDLAACAPAQVPPPHHHHLTDAASQAASSNRPGPMGYSNPIPPTHLHERQLL